MDFLIRNKVFIGAIALTLVLLFGGVYFMSRGSTGSSPTKQISSEVLAPANSEKTSGIVNGVYQPATPSASITLVEFGDYQCPACGAYNSLVKQLLTEFAGKITFVFRDFSFIGPESLKAAQASNCASDQNKFWEYHDYLYSHQNGENKGFFADENLKLFAKDLGLNPQTFGSCLDSEKYKNKVESSTNDGKLAGVDSTPTFFVNGVKMELSATYAEFKAAVTSAK